MTNPFQPDDDKRRQAIEAHIKSKLPTFPNIPCPVCTHAENELRLGPSNKPAALPVALTNALGGPLDAVAPVCCKNCGFIWLFSLKGVQLP